MKGSITVAILAQAVLVCGRATPAQHLSVLPCLSMDDPEFMKRVEELLDDSMKRWDEREEQRRIRTGLIEERLQEHREYWKERAKLTIIAQLLIDPHWGAERIKSANSLINRGYGSSTPTTIERSLKPADWLEDGLKKKQLSHSSGQ